MPEYFEVSFIAKDIESNLKYKLQDLFLKNIHLHEGENNLLKSNYPLLQQKIVLFHIYQYDYTDYIECTISIPHVVFYKESFENDLVVIKNLVTDCFNIYSFDYALCSYEMNSYFITNVKTIADMNEYFLLQFPLYFVRGPKGPIMHVNLKAQDIFIDEYS
jgi:hypothetical protein